MSTMDVRNGSYITLVMGCGDDDGLGNNVALTTRQASCVVPFDATLVKVQMCGDATAGTTQPTIDVYHDRAAPASVLSAAVEIAADNTVYDGTVSISSFSAGEQLTMRCFTHNTAGEMKAASVTLTFEVVPPAIA